MNEGSENNTAERKEKKPKKIGGLLIIGLISLFLIVTTYRTEVQKIYCTDEILAEKPDVIMLSAWWCPYCYKARKYLQATGVSYCEYDMEHSTQGKKLYEQTGAMSIPVLIIGQNIIQGFNENRIDEALEFSKENKIRENNGNSN